MTTRRENIVMTVKDLVTSFLYYDRKEDGSLLRGEIEKSIKAKEITVDEIINEFIYALKKGLDLDKEDY